jgi:cytoskeletal protein RodZ
VSIGEALAEARRQANLTVSEVSDRTRIRETIINGIEGDDYSACGGDFYARGHIRAMARAVGVDPEPLIQEYDSARLGPEAIPEDVTEPVPPIRVPRRHLRGWAAALALVLVTGIGFLGYHLATSPGPVTRAAPSAQSRPVTHPAAPSPSSSASPRVTPTPTPTPTTPAATAAQPLRPASVAAFGPYSSGQGDGPQLAHLAIDRSRRTAWHTDWYTTARFGNLYPGTGLLVDMGHQVTITAARITLGSARGADLQLRVGAAPRLADLPQVARAANAAGVLNLRPGFPARGRYVLIWFTGLPRDPAGTFQASVYDLQLTGQP